MNFQTFSRLTLFAILTHVFGLEGIRLPKDDRLHAGSCLLLNLEHLFNGGTDKAQTTSEFLGTFCTLDVKEIETKFNEQDPAPEKNISDTIKDCLKSIYSNEIIFSRYVVKAKSISKQRKTQSYEEILISALNDQLVDENETNSPAPPDQSDEFSAFAFGLCNSTEFVDFEQLSDLMEIIKTLNCCAECAEELFAKITQIFVSEIQDLEKRLEEGANFTAPVPDPRPISNLGNFKLACENEEVQNIDQINKLGVDRLEKYGGIYSGIDKIYRPMNNMEMDNRLSNAYNDYKNCIRWDCALNLKNERNVPFDAWLKQNIEKEMEISKSEGKPFQHSFSRAVLQKYEWIDWTPTPETTNNAIVSYSPNNPLTSINYLHER